MTRFYFLFLTLLVTFSSCTVTEKPTFITVEAIQINKISGNRVHFNANAIFENKNDVGGKIHTDNIDVLVNGLLIGQLKASEFDVPEKEQFTIPLEGNFSTDKVLQQKSADLLNSVLNILTSKKLPVTFKGDLVFKKGPFSYTYPIDQTNEVPIKL